MTPCATQGTIAHVSTSPQIRESPAMTHDKATTRPMFRLEREARRIAAAEFQGLVEVTVWPSRMVDLEQRIVGQYIAVAATLDGTIADVLVVDDLNRGTTAISLATIHSIRPVSR